MFTLAGLMVTGRAAVALPDAARQRAANQFLTLIRIWTL